MKILKSLKNFLFSLFISTNHWLVRVVTTTMDQLGIGMLLILIFKFLQIQNQRKKFLHNRESEVNFYNLPLGLILIFLGYIAAGVVSFSVVNSYIGPEIFQSGSRFSDENLDPDWIFRNYQTVIAGQIFEYNDVLRDYDNQIIVAQNQEVAYASNGVLCLGYEGLVNFESHYAYLNRLGIEATEYDSRGYGDRKVLISSEFQKLCDILLETGYFWTIDMLSDFVNSDIEDVEASFQDYCANYDRLGISSEIADQQLAIIKNNVETSIEKMKAKRGAIVNKGYADLHALLNESEFVKANQLIDQIRDSLVDVCFQTYKTSVEIPA